MKLNRVQRKVGKKHTSAQSANTTKSASGNTPSESVISTDELGRISQLASAFKVSPLNIFLRGMRLDEADEDLSEAFDILEKTEIEFSVLLELIINSLHTWNEEGSLPKERLERLQTGLMHLSDRLNTSLFIKLDVIRHAVFGKQGQSMDSVGTFVKGGAQ
ncbi:MAG TPA: hypothetical protein VHC44_06835 [Verrucomicrobiae bacterium]|nr:hypothetical protein [Verrucomicrobiae bacterium]